MELISILTSPRMTLTLFTTPARLCYSTIAVQAPIMTTFILVVAAIASILVVIAATTKPSDTAQNLRQLRKQRTRLIKFHQAKKLQGRSSNASGDPLNFSTKISSL